VWTPSASLSNATIANPIATPTVVTTYTVVGTDINGCSATDSINVSLNGISISATASPAAICAGATSNLSVTGATNYTWTPSGSLSNATSANPVANPSNTTTYTVIGSDAASGCADTTTVTLTVNALPNVNAGATLLICAGSTANLSASGASSYSWTPTSSLNNPSIPNPTSTATATTLYTVVGTDVNGCSASDTVSVIVNPVPNANAGSNTSICNGTSTTLNATGGGTYTWLPSTGLSNPSIGNPIANPTTTTTYTVTVTSNFCSATSQVTVTVNSSPTATATTNNANICAGLSAQLTATGGGNYAWTPASSLSSSTIANPIATPTSTTTYTVIVSNVVGCSDTATVTINVTNAMSIASSSITPETCGSTNGVITTGAITGGNSPYTYSLNGGAPQTSPTFSNLTAGTYTITVTDAGGCATTQTVTVNQVLGVNAAFSANPPSGVMPLTVNMNNSSTGATNYIWDFDNGLNSTLTNPSTSYGQIGQYTVTLIAYNNNPACADTATVTVIVYDEVTMAIPNVFTPNGDGINEIFYVSTNGVTEITGTIFNRWGKKIFEWNGTPSTTLGWDGKINGNKAEDGAYYYIISAKGADGKEYNEKGYLQLINGK
jgi:gliding motility-associated-like protein